MRDVSESEILSFHTLTDTIQHPKFLVTVAPFMTSGVAYTYLLYCYLSSAAYVADAEC